MQRESIRTLPGTRERQDILLSADKEGKFFWFTEGGDAKTWDDMLISMAQKELKS